MSVRAYRVIKIEHAQPNTFNLWHDDKLVEFLDKEYGFFEGLNESGGLTEVPIEALKRALKEALTKDIEACCKEGEEYVQYYCF
ncbi:MAG: hypothetical protein J7L92_02810 [Dehalococcoidia bacterium]|nr:hypothetical protein [Dehalococcoidia bacterium]